MLLQGGEKDKPFNVLGSFATRPDSPDWGWRSEIVPGEQGELLITPEGLEWKRVGMIYQRTIEK